MDQQPHLLSQTALHHFLARDGHYAGYLNAIEQAINNLTDQPISEKSLVTAVGYQLVRNRLAGIANSLYPPIIKRAIELGVWTPQLALSLLDLCPPEPVKLPLDDRLLEVTRTQLIRQLRGEPEIDAHQEPFATNSTTGNAQQPQFTDEQAREQFQTIMAGEIGEREADLLIDLFPYLDSAGRKKAMSKIFASILMKYTSYINGAFQRICDLLPRFRHELLDTAVTMLINKDDLPNLTHLDLLDHVPEIYPRVSLEVQRRLLDYVREPALLRPDPDIIELLMQTYDDEQKQALLETAINLPVTDHNAYSSNRSNYQPVAPRALICLIPYFEGSDRQRVIDSAYEMTLTLADVGHGFEYIYSPIAEIVAELAPYLEGEQWQRAMERGITGALTLPEFHHMGSRPRFNTLQLLAPLMDADQVKALLGRFFQPETVWDTQWMDCLFAYVESDKRQSILRQIIEKADRAESDPQSQEFNLAGTLTQIARHLEGEVAQEAIDLALGLNTRFGGSYSRAGTLAAIASHISQEWLAYMLDQLDGMLAQPDHQHDATYKNSEVFGFTLAVIAPYLKAPDLIARARTMADAITRPLSNRTLTLSALVPNCEANLRPELIDDVLAGMRRGDAPRNYENHDRPRSPLTAMVPFLDASQFDEAFDIALSDEKPTVRLTYWVDLFPYLKGNRRDQALATVREDLSSKTYDTFRNFIIAKFAPHLTEDENDTLFDLVVTDDTETSWTTSQFIEKHIAFISDNRLSSLLDGAFGHYRANQLTSLIKACAPKLTGDNLRRIVDFLLEHRTDADFAEQPKTGVMARMQTNPDNDYFRGKMFSSIIPYLETDQLEPVRSAIHQMVNPLSIATCHAKFVAHHVADASGLGMIEQALQAVPQIAHEGERLEALESFDWDELTLSTATYEFSQIDDPLLKARLVAHVLPYLTDPQPTTSEIQRAIIAYLRSDPSASVYVICADVRLCTSQIFGARGLQKIADDMTQIYEEWTWLPS